MKGIIRTAFQLVFSLPLNIRTSKSHYNLFIMALSRINLKGRGVSLVKSMLLMSSSEAAMPVWYEGVTLHRYKEYMVIPQPAQLISHRKL